VYYFKKIFFETGHVMHLRDGSEAPVLTVFPKITAYKKRRSFTYIVFQKCPQILSQIYTNDLYVTEKWFFLSHLIIVKFLTIGMKYDN
jgi:hypothetical protein